MTYINLFARSGGNNQTSADGSNFLYRISPPIQVPASANNPTVEMNSATVWYNTPNIKASENDQLVATFANISSGSDQILIFPTGLYDLTALNTRVNIILQGLGLNGDEIVFSGDTAQQKAQFILNPSTASGVVRLSFSNANFTMKSLLGFTTTTDIDSSVSTLIEADEIAQLNSLSYYQISCDIIGDSVVGADGRRGSDILAVIVPNASPSSQITAEPSNPIRLPLSVPAGGIIQKIRFQLKSALMQPLSGEYAVRRETLEQLPFPIGYGVETSHLIDVYQRHGLDAFAQTDLDRRVHRNQSTTDLGKMSFGILQSFLNRIKHYDIVRGMPELPAIFRQLQAEGRRYEALNRDIVEEERPPIITLPEYRKRHGR